MTIEELEKIRKKETEDMKLLTEKRDLMRQLELDKLEQEDERSKLSEFDKYLIEAEMIEAGESDLKKFKAKKTEFIEWFDLDKIKSPLFIRFRQAGDRFIPLGLDKEKKVGKFLTSARVPEHIRQKILIICDSEKIIWVWPVRISEQTRVTAKTREILQLKITDAALAT